MTKQTTCPYCHSTNVTIKKKKIKSGDKVTEVLGITAALGVAALTALAAPVVAPFVAVLGVSGVEKLCHVGAHRAAEAGKDEYIITHVCNDCGHEF